MALNEAERAELNELLATGRPLPEKWLPRLFPNAKREAPVGKEYRLVYDGKLSREEVLAQTPAAPWQHVRSYCTERPHPDGWKNLLVWGDNLLALRELLADQQGPNRYGTRGKIQLIYIDPPFATKQDFMKDKEKAYRDKVFGAQFIEFIRRRVVLLRELLSNDGSICVHLDTKKSHYIKAVLDEVFGEENFRNEIIWKRAAAHSDAGVFSSIHDTIFLYSKSDNFHFVPQYVPYSDEYSSTRYKHLDPDGRRYMDDNLTATGLKGGGYDYIWKGVRRIWRCPQTTMEQYERDNKLYYTRKGVARLKRYLDEMKGLAMQDVWTDIFPVNSQAAERVEYPTQKPEELIGRILHSLSKENDIVLDCFGGSGTTAAVAEKLGRRWISVDCGKLAINTTQKRLFTLTKGIGTSRKDERTAEERVDDWKGHLKHARGILFLTEKARTGECDITLEFLSDLAGMVEKHSWLRKDGYLSLVCPEDKLHVPDSAKVDIEEGPGDIAVEVAGMEFRISFVTPKESIEKEQALPATEFALFRAGLYDMDSIKELPWETYRPFVLQLFGVRDHTHKRYGFDLDGYIGTHSVSLWNYPDNKNVSLDHDFVDDLHRTLRGKAGERFYVIAPVTAMAFAEDEITKGGATYVFLKVPLSILMRLIQQKEPAAFKQPAKEDDVNAIIDAVGFDFISQPQMQYKALRESRPGEIFPEYVLRIEEFRAKTLATDVEDFENFETFSMAMVDVNYNDDVFRLSKVFWGEDLLEEAGGLQKAKYLELRLTEEEFTGEQAMIILCDRYGNEKSLLLKKDDFVGEKATARKKSTGKRKAVK